MCGTECYFEGTKYYFQGTKKVMRENEMHFLGPKSVYVLLPYRAPY